MAAAAAVLRWCACACCARTAEREKLSPTPFMYNERVFWYEGLRWRVHDPLTLFAG